MTQGEKAKAYDEALERARKLYNDAKANEYKSDMEDYEYIFPELAESEDERIRKWLIEYFEFASKCWIHRDITPEQIFAYLERQKEKALIPDELVENYKRFCEQGGKEVAAIINAVNWQKEHKPAEWSEKDELMISHICSLIQHISKTEDCREIAWLKSLPERFNLQPKQEWSEEDEKDMAHIIRILDDCYVYGTYDLSKTDYENLVNKLKSLRPSWKPSQNEDSKNSK